LSGLLSFIVNKPMNGKTTFCSLENLYSELKR